MRLAALVIVAACYLLSACKKPESPPVEQAGPTPAVNPTPASQPPAEPTPTCSFEWISSAHSATLWTEVSEAFAQELRPDTASGDPSQSGTEFVYPVKHIVRVARCGDAAVVILEKSTNKKGEDWNRLFEIYTYSLKNKTKSSIEAKWPFWL